MSDQTLRKILCVEDEPDIREVAKLTLEAIGGFTVQTCSSGKDAVENAPAFQPDLILLDVMMPDMSGPETLEAMRALPQFQDTPIVFMTAKTQAEEVARFKSLGALDVIKKPFDPVALPSQIADIWTNRFARRSG